MFCIRTVRKKPVILLKRVANIIIAAFADKRFSELNPKMLSSCSFLNKKSTVQRHYQASILPGTSILRINRRTISIARRHASFCILSLFPISSYDLQTIRFRTFAAI